MLNKFLRRSFRKSKNFQSKRERNEPVPNLERSKSLPARPSVTKLLPARDEQALFDVSSSSPEKSLEIISKDDTLFDDRVLEAFQVGNLSIADFLKSPHTSPNMREHKPYVEKIERSRSEGFVKSFEDAKRDGEIKPSPATEKKLSLLDQAHSSNKQKLPLVKQKHVLRSESSMENGSCIKDKRDGNNQHLNSEPEVSGAAQLSQVNKTRFSKSLETLAQQVFGEEYESYLKSASASPVKRSFSNVATIARPENANLEIRVHCTKYVIQKPLREKAKNNLKSPTKPTLVKRSTAPSPQIGVPKQKDSIVIHSFDSNAVDSLDSQNLESWDNQLDLRSRKSSTVSRNSSVSFAQEEVILNAINENDDGDPVNETSLSSQDNRDRGRTLGALGGRSLLRASPHFQEKVCKSDSQIVNVGSFSDDDLSEAGSSPVDINFPPPPPIDNEFLASENLEKDSLIDSLMSLVPLPEDPDRLVPVLSDALSEIISEIVTSRRKLGALTKTIHIHQQILKEQSEQIKIQHKEIDELKKTAYALNNYQSFLKCSNSSGSSRSSRQSRELVVLNHTLDKLLLQCWNLQKCSAGEDALEPIDDTLTDRIENQNENEQVNHNESQ